MSIYWRSITAAVMVACMGLAGCSDSASTKKKDSASCSELDCAGENRACVDGDDCGECLEGYRLDDTGQCVLARCSELDCAADNRVCTEATGDQGARCASCVDGYVDSDEEQTECVPNEAAVCDPAGDPNSIVAKCTGLFRACVDATDDAPAECGDCTDGYKPDPDGGESCVPFKTCADLSCEEGQVCFKPEGEEATCRTNPCADDEALNGFGECVTCANDDFEGCTGENFAQASGANRCVCKTKPGWFWNPGLTPARPDVCDDDEDGWVDQQAAEFYKDTTRPVLADAANCNWHIIDRFELVNDVPNSEPREVSVSELSGGALTEVVLKESVRNDDPARFVQANLPDYGGTSFEPKNLNSLTKACVSTNADFNDNGSADLIEVQKKTTAGTPGDVFARMSYFIETANGYFTQGDTPDELGKYVIRELTRGTELPISYESTAGARWKTCTRFADARTSESNPRDRIGTDFGQYAPASGAAIWEAGDSWKGMNHSSQFKCINVLAVAPDPVDDGAHVVLKDEVAGGPDAKWSPGYTVNVCRLSGNPRPEPGAPSGIMNAAAPEVLCDLTTPVTEGVKWAAVNYQATYGQTINNGATREDYQYERGCADECVTRRPLCTGMSSPTASEDSGSCYTDPNDFGQRYCGCNITFGGVDCDFGCPSAADVFISPGYNPGNRAEQFWACGQVTESEAGAFGGDGYSVTGHVPQAATDRSQLCADPNDCSTGFSVR